MPPLNALSPVNYYGIVAEKRHKPISKFGITWKIATRSLSRHQNAVVRMVILLSAVFVLLTISIAGGVIARDTTSYWVQDPTSTNSINTVAVAHSSVGERYLGLLSTFSGGQLSGNFDYSSPNYVISSSAIDNLKGLNSVAVVDERLVFESHIVEDRNFTVIGGETFWVGGTREGESLIIGLNPYKENVPAWFEGRFLGNASRFEAVIGDSIATKMYSPDQKLNINYSDPLVQSVKIFDKKFVIDGVCIDPINKGFVTYVPLETLENLTGLSPNLVLVTPKEGVDEATFKAQLQKALGVSGGDLASF